MICYQEDIKFNNKKYIILIYTCIIIFFASFSLNVLAENRSSNMQAALTAIDNNDYDLAMREFKVVLSNPNNDTKINILVANYNIGYMLANGLGVEKNLSEAVKYYRVAADGGLHMAENTLGIFLIKGMGVEVNETEGWSYIRKAAKKSNKNAIKALRSKCLTSEVPNPEPLPDENTLFYGDCENGRAVNGIVIWQVKGVSTDISCLNNGSYKSNERTDSFNECKPYWFILPDFCEYKGFTGQCKDGIAHGVGFETETVQGFLGNGSMYIKKGQFENGLLHGYGFYSSITGCGMAGCSGNLVKETGWFEKGNLIFSCSNYPECLPKLSGRSFVSQKATLSADDLSKINTLRSQSSFESALEAFNLAGDKNDLKTAQKLAKTKQQKAQLEYTLMRVAGFDKVISLNASVSNGNNSVNLDDKEHLLGFFQSVNASIPIKIEWKLSSIKSILPLQYGDYTVEIKVGVNVLTSRKTCIGIICTSKNDTDKYWNTYNVNISNKTRYSGSGIYDLSVNSSNSSSLIFANSKKTIAGIEPVISIESVKLLP